MQTMSWSSEEVKSEFGGCLTFGDVINKLESQVWDEGRVVCEIKINGVTITENEEKKFADASSATIDRLEIMTRTPVELVTDSVTSYLDLLTEIKAASFSCADAYRDQDPAEASQQLSGILEGCRWFTDALVLLKSNIEKWTDYPLMEKKWSECELEFSKVVRDLLKHFEAGDTSQLADVLEYDLTNCLDNWMSLFKNVASELS